VAASGKSLEQFTANSRYYFGENRTSTRRTPTLCHCRNG